MLANLAFVRKSNGGGETEIGRWHSNGYLGVNNTAPAYHIDVGGNINTPGTSGNTYRWNANTTAPATAGAAPIFTDYYGGNTKALGDPAGFLLINVGGTDKKIPYY